MTEAGSKNLQYMAAAASNLNIMACGAILGWTSPILPKYSLDPIAEDNQLGRPITKDEGSWLGSLVPLGVMCGSFISGYLGEWFGRKRALLMCTFPFIVGWILVGTAKDIIQMYVGRFILGFNVAIPFTIIPMYTGEISEVSIRGALGSFLQLFITFGFLFSYAVGPYVTSTVFWLLCASLHLASFLCFMFMPESPYFLLSRGREAEALETLARFRGKSQAAVQKEIEAIQCDRDDKRDNGTIAGDKKCADVRMEIDEASRSRTTWADAFRVKVNRKAILLTCMLMVFQEVMGIDVVLFYVEDIFRDAGTKNTAASAIVIGFVQMISSVVTPIVVDKSGRKILLIISSIGSGVTVGLLGMYFYLRAIEYDVSNMTWVPLTTLIIYIIAYSLGWGPLPWTVMSEIFSPGVKTKASSICVFTIWTFSFLLTKFFANVEEAYGAYTGFWFFAACSVLSIAFIVLVFPETKGKTLLEIQHKIAGTRAKPSPGNDVEGTITNYAATNDSKIVNLYGQFRSISEGVSEKGIEVLKL